MTGADPDYYEFDLADERQDGNRVVRLRSVTIPAPTFGAFAQMIAADAYVGKRVRLSAALRATDVTGWGELRVCDVGFEEVAADVPVTGEHTVLAAHPRNLDFGADG